MTVAALASAARARAAGYDGALIAAAAVLLGAGFVLSLAASPVAVERMGYDGGAFAFAWRHAAFVVVGLVAFAFTASLSPIGVRRVGGVLYLIAVALMVLVLIVGDETKGAQRWLDLGAFKLQPSELLKPALVVLCAWMLAERMKSPRFPGLSAVGALFALAAGLLLLQPDVGQTALIALTVGALLFAAGVSWLWLAGLAAGGALVLGALYALLPHVRARIDAFLGPEAGYQVGRALEAITGGGVLGRGPGEGVVKQSLPDAHSDFIYAVSAEEFGLFASLGLLSLYAMIAWRGLGRAGRLVDPFQQLAACGLVTLFTLQAAIHIAVNLSLLPAKGMTLPLVSYGGSSMLGSAVTLGLAFALMRRRPGAFLYEGER